MADELKIADGEGLLAACAAGGPSASCRNMVPANVLAAVCAAGNSSASEAQASSISSLLATCAEGGPSVRELAGICEQMAPERWRAVSDAAQVVANYLACHPAVAEVRYPGLRCDPSYHEASCVLRAGFGPEVHLRLAGEGAWLRYFATDAPATTQVLALEEALRGGIAAE